MHPNLTRRRPRFVLAGDAARVFLAEALRRWEQDNIIWPPGHRYGEGWTLAPGWEFRVVREGLTLTGDTPVLGGARGWEQVLHVGDILTCTGHGPGSGGDPGYGVEFTSQQSEAGRAFHCAIWPMNGGPFAYRPPAGSLEPAGDDGGEAKSDG